MGGTPTGRLNSTYLVVAQEIEEKELLQDLGVL